MNEHVCIYVTISTHAWNYYKLTRPLYKGYYTDVPVSQETLKETVRQATKNKKENKKEASSNPGTSSDGGSSIDISSDSSRGSSKLRVKGYWLI